MLYAQNMPEMDPDTQVTIGSVYIIGNKKTRDEIILRELDIEAGRTFSAAQLKEILVLDQQKLMNTRLFIAVEIVPLFTTSNQAEVLVRVIERWYIFPVPIFKLADRSFTEWWVNQKRDFSRVNYGLQLQHMNLTGRNDKMSIRAQFGFTKQFALQYQIPYVNKAQTIGLNFSTSYSNNKTVSYASSGHRQLFLESEDELRNNFSIGSGLNFRPNFYNRHSFSLFYGRNNVSEELRQLNPSYLSSLGNTQNYFAMSYTFRHDRRDFISYPLTGRIFEFSAQQIGLGVFNDVDMFTGRASYATFNALGKKLYLANGAEVYQNFAERIPYLFRSGFGYHPDILRGYDLYVIETDFLFSYRSSLKFELIKGVKELNPRSVIDQFRSLPYAAYLKIFFDAGFAGDALRNNENNFLNNSWIGSMGIGLDIVTYYDFVMRFEYSINKEGDTGFFFNFRSAL
mgnify:CR=1 FL=1